MYVEYQIPAAQKYRYPVIMMHGGGHTAKTYETTPDGREGWFTTFARRGFSPYAVDAPNRGRSGYDPTHRFKVLAGLEPASALEIGNIYSRQGAWVSFRLGPKYGERYPGQLFPFDYMDDYVKELVPSYRGAEQNPLIVNDLVALIDKLGPCILLGHSTGGANVLNAATLRPEKVKGLIALEPSGFPPEANRAALKTVPTIIVLGDNRAPSSNDTPKALTSFLSGLGGDATTYLLPEHGISGNGHMMMMESNSEQIADLLEDWIRKHVPSASMTSPVTSPTRPTN
jgi:pimeloyl-ACP methyl ester carboxylesterase